MKDTLKKFSGRADDYVAGRPAYAEEFVRWLALLRILDQGQENSRSSF